MGILAEAPRGGLAEDLAGASRALVLRNAEIERFEDRHRGIFAVWDGFLGRDVKPSLREVRDLVALGLVGGGMPTKEADRIMGELPPSESQFLYQVAQGLVGVAFMPDLPEAGGDEDLPEDANEKKTQPAPGG